MPNGVDISIEFEGIREAIDAANADEALGPPVTRFMNSSLFLFEGEIRREMPVGADGLMRQRLAGIPSFERPFPKFLRLVVGTSYAIYNLKGTRPHWPPFGPGSSLRRWVHLKLGIEGNPAAEDSEARRLAGVSFLVARKIAASGTPANDWLGRGVQNGLPQFKDLARQMIRDIGRRLSSDG